MKPISHNAAMALARDALLWLLEEPERIGGFLGASGLSAGDLRSLSTEPDLLGAVLDHLLTEDAWLLAFAQETNHSPETVVAARATLPGGDVPHWT